MNTTKIVDVNKKLYKVFDNEFNKLESSSISDHYTNINDSFLDKPMLDYNKINININFNIPI